MKDSYLLITNGIDVGKALELFGTMDKYDKTLTVFYDTIEEKIAQLKTAKSTSNMAEYARLAHSLKSEAKYFGMVEFGELAYKHELGAKANNMYFIYDNFEELITEINRIVLIVGQYLGREVKITTSETKPESVKDHAILVVDDSNIIRHFIQQVFQETFEILSANDGGEAIKIIENNSHKNIIGVLLDLNMPNINGFAVLDYFQSKDLFKKIPVCIITGIDTREVDERAFGYPILDMLKKPFNERDIKAKVEKFISYNESRE